MWFGRTCETNGAMMFVLTGRDITYMVKRRTGVRVRAVEQRKIKALDVPDNCTKKGLD